ncbi:hypothetical protein AAMO2058_001023700 [Amorphochlora amoebiformis]
MPHQVIKERIHDNEVVFVTLLSKANRKRGEEMGTLWEAVAYTPVHQWNAIKLRPRIPPEVLGKPPKPPTRYEFPEPIIRIPKVKLWCNMNGWWEPQNIPLKITEKAYKIEAPLLVPPASEIQFYFEVDGKKILADNYKRKKVSIGEIDHTTNIFMLDVRLPAFMEEQKQQDVIESDSDYSSTSDEEETEQNQTTIPSHFYQFSMEPTQEEYDRLFDKDWKEIQILDVVKSKEERDLIYDILHDSYPELREIFQRLAGRDSPLEYMSANDFSNFVKETKVLKYGFNTTFTSVVFKRININEIVAEDGKGYTLFDDPSNPRSMFTRSEWLESLVRIVVYWTKLKKRISSKLKQILNITLKRYMGDIEKDNIRDLMRKPDTRQTFEPYLGLIYRIFDRFAALGKDIHGSYNTMSEDEYTTFVLTFNISTLSPKLGRRKVGQALAYSQTCRQDDSRGYLTNYAEFLEVLARLATSAFPKLKPLEAIKKIGEHLSQKAISLKMFEKEANDDDSIYALSTSRTMKSLN